MIVIVVQKEFVLIVELKSTVMINNDKVSASQK